MISCHLIDGVKTPSADGDNIQSDGGAPDPPTYTVTWVNYDGTVLETDTGVEWGTTPSYDGKEPEKSAEGDFTFKFDGWTPLLSPVSSNVTYTAAFSSVYSGGHVLGMEPELTDDGCVLYGIYPQSKVSDNDTINALNTLSPTSVNGWYLYENQYYAKATANVYNSESYTFDDGEQILSGVEYWFLCEPIRWRILSDENGRYYLLSDMLLDARLYYTDYNVRTENGEKIYANSYAESDIRAWLNGEFFNTAFILNSTFVKTTAVDNNAETTNMLTNPYISDVKCEDKVTLPSYADYINSDYGFAASEEKTAAREAKTTDYARAVGAWCNTRNNSNSDTVHNGSYWTRSASGEYDYCASVVNSGGFISTYAVDDTSHSVRPAIYINHI